MLTQSAIELVSQVKVFVTTCRRGKAGLTAAMVRVPEFVFRDSVNFCGKEVINGGNEFAAYYLAHELAHIKAGTGTHNGRFMAAFKELCPPDLQWYETIYKPKRAAAAGIARSENQ